MLPNLALVGDLARALGYPHVWLKRKIRKVEASAGLQLLHGPNPLRVDVGQLRQACPELFPVDYCRAAAELRAELKRSRRRQQRLEGEMEQLTESAYALYEFLSNKIDHQRSAAITFGPMDEGHRLPLPAKREEQQTINGANDGPTFPEAPGASRH